MVLGIRSKSRKSVAIQVDYIIYVQEIKPWPLSRSLKSVQSVLLQWENGDQGSGSFISTVGDGKLEFTDSFRLSVTLCKEASRKGTTRESYQKNNLEFSLYEPRKDKAMKGQLLGTALVNLADYGIIKETVYVSTPVSFKKSSKSSEQPVLYVIIQPLSKDSSSSSPTSGLSKEVSREIDGNESVSEAMTEMNDEEVEIASFTDDEIDDDVSSQSSRIVNSSGVEIAVSSQTMKIGSETAKKDVERGSADPAVSFRDEPTSIELSPPVKTFNHPKESSSPSLSRGYSAILGNPATIGAPFPHVQQERSIPTLKKSVTHSIRSSSSLGYPNYPDKSDNKRVVVNSAKMPEYAHESTSENVVANISNKVASSSVYIQDGVNENTASYSDSLATQEYNKKTRRQNSNRQVEVTLADSLAGLSGNMEPQEYEQKDHVLKLKEYSIDVKQSSRLSQDASRDDSSTLSSKDIGGPGNIDKSNKEKHLKSVELPVDVAMNNRVLENAELIDKPYKGKIKGTNDGAMIKAAGAEKGIPKNFSDGKAELESEIEMLKEELQEAAAVEVALYSVVAEHGSSSNKIHAPARRLSRFYQHACKANSQAKKANAARAAISGFILVSKACGNDVPRLTFWLSNSIVLRAILSQTVGKQQLPAGRRVNYNGLVPPREKKNDNIESFDDWGDPLGFMIALEKFEAWIFSRIVESVWWQTMTPHMQPAAAKGSSLRKTYGRKHGLGDRDQGNFSIDLWKKAFKDACERLCPAQAVGHDCGCLPMLARLVMEQLVSRLDVAMFNAILRENGEEMPTDPVSDPISDSKVLPIQAGKSSFGAGAQLKNAIGSWSRWLTDLFGIDDNDAPEDKNEDENELGDGKRLEPEISFKPFRLLNALSDLMMLPFEMVADKSIRKEVCPAFSGPLIKMVLYNFVPDEFCPNPIPDEVFEALDSEDDSGVDEETVTSVPCIAKPTIYLPPSATSLTSIIGEVGNQTLNRSGSLLRKAYTSDDELDELDSPITSIIKDITPTSIPKKKGDRPVIRYQLLREAWKDGE